MNDYIFILDSGYYRESHCYTKNGKTICEYKTEISSDVNGIGKTGASAEKAEIPTLDVSIILIIVFILCIVFGMFLAFGICKKVEKEKKKD